LSKTKEVILMSALTQTCEKYNLKSSEPLLSVLFEKLSVLSDSDQSEIISHATAAAIKKTV